MRTGRWSPEARAAFFAAATRAGGKELDIGAGMDAALAEDADWLVPSMLYLWVEQVAAQEKVLLAGDISIRVTLPLLCAILGLVDPSEPPKNGEQVCPENN